MSRDNHLQDSETARERISEAFRKAHGIDSEDTVVYFAPGDTIGENEYTLEDFRKGYNEFIYKYSYPTSLSQYAPKKSCFKLIVSIHKGTESEKFIQDFIQGSEFATDVIFVNNEDNSHFRGICASDFGFVYNGQMLSSAVALHLNVMTMQDMNDLHYFWHTWENRWLADINVAADRPAVPEFAAGEFWFGKLANKMADMHTNTDKRWDQVRLLRPFVPQMLSFKNPIRGENDERDIRFIANDQSIYDEYQDPIYLMSEKVAHSMASFKNRIAVQPDLDVIKSIPSIKLNNSLDVKL